MKRSSSRKSGQVGQTREEKKEKKKCRSDKHARVHFQRGSGGLHANGHANATRTRSDSNNNKQNRSTYAPVRNSVMVATVARDDRVARSILFGDARVPQAKQMASWRERSCSWNRNGGWKQEEEEEERVPL